MILLQTYALEDRFDTRRWSFEVAMAGDYPHLQVTSKYMVPLKQPQTFTPRDATRGRAIYKVVATNARSWCSYAVVAVRKDKAT
jgi:hypothetical protein